MKYKKDRKYPMSAFEEEEEWLTKEDGSKD
jgi:hypothetical protein